MSADTLNDITFWYDPISPYAYLAFERLPEALMGLSVRVRYRPVLFATLLKANGQLGPAEIPSKRDWTYRQVGWLAHQHGVTLDLPAAHPFNPLALLRLGLATATDDVPGETNRYVTEQLFHHVWHGGGGPLYLADARGAAWINHPMIGRGTALGPRHGCSTCTRSPAAMLKPRQLMMARSVCWKTFNVPGALLLMIAEPAATSPPVGAFTRTPASQFQITLWCTTK